MEKSSQAYLRQQLAKHIDGGEAFKPIETVLDKIPYDKTGIIPDPLPYSIWQQLYHIRYSQLDILKFSRDPNYKVPNWPDDYWPSNPSPATEEEWKALKKSYFQEKEDFIRLIKDESLDLFSPLQHGDGQTLFREAILVIEHTAYHSGQLLLMMRLLELYE